MVERDLNMLCDADMLIHPHFPDVHQIVKDPAYVAFNDNYNISTVSSKHTILCEGW